MTLALDAWDVVERLGSPEGELTLAQAVLYMASAPKSNAVYAAFNAVRNVVQSEPAYDVPLHIRNAPTGLMKKMGYHRGYQYPHDHEGHFVKEAYLPEKIKDRVFYHPSDEGSEEAIKKRLAKLWPEKYK